MQHTPVFLAAVADVWNSSKLAQGGIGLHDVITSDSETGTTEEKKWVSSINEKLLPAVMPLQESLLEMILSIKVIIFANLILLCGKFSIQLSVLI